MKLVRYPNKRDILRDPTSKAGVGGMTIARVPVPHPARLRPGASPRGARPDRA